MGEKTVVVVDDDSLIRQMIRWALEEEGYVVLEAENGRDALQVLARHKPDLILLDMNMPVMDGWEFARTYRREADGTGAPIIVLTAALDARRWAQEVEAAAYLGKPFQIAELFAKVQEFC
jgi:CheY-like chemotaxis protein